MLSAVTGTRHMQRLACVNFLKISRRQCAHKDDDIWLHCTVVLTAPPVSKIKYTDSLPFHPFSGKRSYAEAKTQDRILLW